MAQHDDKWKKREGHAARWLAGLGDWLDTPPPPALAPPPRVDQKAWTESLNSYHPAGGNETVAEIGGIVNAETQGMKDRAGENESLQAAREKIAHVRINGIRQFGPNDQQVPKMASPIMTGPDYQASLEAARLAAVDDALGVDPTHGAMHYNMRTDAQTARGGARKGEQPVSKSGPYQSPAKFTYIWTYK